MTWSYPGVKATGKNLKLRKLKKQNHFFLIKKINIKKTNLKRTIPLLHCWVKRPKGPKASPKGRILEVGAWYINKLIIPRLECGILEVERAIGCIPWHLPKASSSSCIIIILILQHYLDDNPAITCMNRFKFDFSHIIRVPIRKPVTLGLLEISLLWWKRFNLIVAISIKWS